MEIQIPGRFVFFKQLYAMDCGPTCLKMIVNYYGKNYDIRKIRELSGINKIGVSMLGISEVAEKIGFRTRGVKITFPQLMGEVQLPCILHWDQSHFVVLPPQSRSKLKKKILVADPSKGMIHYSQKEFLDYWISSHNVSGDEMGTVLLIEPTQSFMDEPDEQKEVLSWKLPFHYFKQSKWKVFQVLIALIITSLFQLVLPYLTQSIVDTGINTQNLQYITIVLIAQLVLIISRSIIDFLQTRMLMGISIIVNLSILSDFWIKLTKLPLSYFDRYHTGDTIQRIGDNKQIHNFLTTSALSTIFSLFNFIVFSIVLIRYNFVLFTVFSIGCIVYFLWIKLFLVVRRKINYQMFYAAAKENIATLQLVQGMQEIRINNAEKIKRWEWEDIQVGVSKLQLKNLNYNQLQQVGALLINQGKDIYITFLVAQMVIEGKLSFGAMLAVQYIIGQLASPIEHFIGFIQNAQDAKISMERLNEIHRMNDEEEADRTYIRILPENKSIQFKNVSFSYPGAGNDPVLNNINLIIPEGKVTAIVGTSGSGKTTLLKLLLKIYDNYIGDIKIGDNNFRSISSSFWRNKCGAVLQDGYIFNDSIAKNISVSDDIPDFEKLITACKLSNILSFIENMPNGFHSMLGPEGVGISQGQKQRLLIARAIYKNPEYLFFDEATNSLDANNERAIVEGLQDYYEGRTVVIIAHRLSTVRSADKIVVIKDGRIVEEGSHSELSAKKGTYFELVRNQLELGC